MTNYPQVSNSSSDPITAEIGQQPSVLTDVQLEQIKIIVTFIMEECVCQIVDITQTRASTQYGHGLHNVPASYIKQIQSGEFFETVVLTLKKQ